MNEELLINKILCGVFVINEDGIIKYTNQAFLNISGYNSKNIIGKNFADLKLTSGSSNNNKMKWQTCLRPRESEFLHRKLYLTKENGLEMPVLISGYWENKRANQYDGIFCIVDVSEHQLCEMPLDSKNLERENYYGIIGKSQKMQDVYDQIEMTAKTNVNVVIQGESGTGKELVANAIHTASERRTKPFIRVNCSSLTETLLESELFGHVKGAFTGAYKDRIGRFEEANQGTLFLDEIGEISLNVQVKLLRVLQERIIVRVGDNKDRPVDVRIISATNKNLRSLVKKNIFRDDLFYRLNVFPISLAPLRERGNDIALLCNFFLQKYHSRTGKSIDSISSNALRNILHYCWPGNIRELENAIEHAFVVCSKTEITTEDLPEDIREISNRETICKDTPGNMIPTPIEIHTVKKIEPRKSGKRLNISKSELLQALELNNNNKAATSRSLGISTVALWKKIKKFEI